MCSSGLPTLQSGLPDLLLAKGLNLVQKKAKKEPNSNTRDQQKDQAFFPILTAITKSCEMNP